MTPTKLATTAALIAMAADVPLAKKYPLHDSKVSMTQRVVVTGALVFASVWLAGSLLRR